MLLATLLIVLHREKRGLADGQKVSGQQIQILVLVLGERVEGKVLETFRRHFDRGTGGGGATRNSKWPPTGRIRCCSPSSTATAGGVGFLRGYSHQTATRGCRVTELSALVAGSGGEGKGGAGVGVGKTGKAGKSPEAEKHFPKKS